MRRAILLFIQSFIVFNFAFGQFLESFSDGDFTNGNTWYSNSPSSWKVETNSSTAQGATNSNTLKLNATGAQLTYLSIRPTGNWGEEQTWSFWLGRHNFPATAQNSQFVWLWADKMDFSSTEINGYRIKFGDNTTNGDDITLQVVKNGVPIDLISDNNVVPNGLVNFGLTVFVTRTRDGKWSVYSSASPTSNNSGENANANSETSSFVNRNSNLIPVVDNSFYSFEGGYTGFMAICTATPDALKAAEFDQYNFTPSISYESYSWTGATNNTYEEASNWNPVRKIRRTTDRLSFASDATINKINDDVIGQLNINGISTVTMANVSPVKITITGIGNIGLAVSEGSGLQILSNEDFTISLMQKASGKISGRVSMLKSVAGIVNHKLLGAETKSIMVEGSFLQNCSGNIFGSGNSIPDTIVVFTEGSEFISRGGATPFGNIGTKVKFEQGSWYRHEQFSPFSSSGKKYANFELNLPSSTSPRVTLNTANLDTMRVDEFRITHGELRVSNSGGNVAFKVNGNLIVSPAGKIELTSSSRGRSEIFLTGTGKSINAGNRISFNQNSLIQLRNNYSLADNLSISGSGTLSLKEGVLNLNGHSLTFTDRATIQKIKGSLSASLEINTKLRYVFGDGTSNEPIYTGPELQKDASVIIINNPGDVNLSRSVLLTDSLVLNKGKVFSHSNYITVDVEGKATNGSSVSFVAGKLAKKANKSEEFVFPVGQENLYKPISLITTSSEPSLFISTFHNMPPPRYNEKKEDGAFLDDLQSISNVEYWDIQRIGAGKAKVKLFWDPTSQLSIIDPNDLRVAFYNGEGWEDKGNTGIYNNISNGYVISENLNDFGHFTFGSNSNNVTFPVIFLSFSAKRSINKVEITWKTALEINNKGFEIQKSDDASNFSTIGFVEAAIGDAPNKSYRFYDEDFDGSVFYRIKQVDNNGDFLYSSVIHHSWLRNKTAQVFPNPFQENLSLFLDIDHQTTITVHVKNNQGEILGVAEGDLKSVNLSLNSMMEKVSNGIYYFVVSNQTQQLYLKVIKN